MRAVLIILSRIIGWVNQTIAVVGIVAGVALTFVNVVARYIFDGSLTWASELTIYLFLWSIFFGAAYCFKQDAHISVDVVVEKLPPSWAKAILILVHSVTLVFLVAVAWYGYEYLLLEIDLDERSVDLDIPMWIPYLVIPMAFASAAYRVIEKIIEIIATPAQDVVRKSEAEMLLAEMEGSAHQDILQEAKRRTGDML